jgi:radical SAM superfamily enzyme YgiQ (UPF0313 family)
MRDFEAGELKSIYRVPQTQISNYIVKHELLPANGIYPHLHFIEASRGCNFKCDFCVLPAENAKGTLYALDTVIETIERAIKTTPWWSPLQLHQTLLFIDNNFANSFSYMEQLCAALRNIKAVKSWGALATQNVLKKRDLIITLARSKCKVLFIGIESFDPEFLRQHNKKQNAVNVASVFDDIRFAQKQGIIVIYPYMLDPRVSSVADMKQQLEMFNHLSDLTFPDFFTTASPLVGTQLFWESVDKSELIANLRLRDLDGQTLSFSKVADSYEHYSEFFKLLYTDTLKLFDRKKVMRNLYKNTFKMGIHRPIMMLFFYQSSLNHIHDAANNMRPIRRNYIGGQDVLDPQYQQYPVDISPSDKEKYFAPIQVTDANGNLCEWLKPYQSKLMPSAL